ncbi:hypothetical protein [Rhizobium rhizogenes]|uniref:hypothetical protein n=1 Tax=Rhizobium rhizogenes TaxID=359 RepID=UPI0015741CEF|nr:hypothetical protein [Rhizobium rhizogenes]NTG08855.1 hypothetical protein [Rhizobium rhizogenes]
MDEQDHRKALGDKQPDTQLVKSDDKEFNDTSDVGSILRDNTVRSRIVIKEGRRRESLKKRRPFSTDT